MNKFYNVETMGDGASKLSGQIKYYIGLNERNIQRWLNTINHVSKRTDQYSPIVHHLQQKLLWSETK